MLLALTTVLGQTPSGPRDVTRREARIRPGRSRQRRGNVDALWVGVLAGYGIAIPVGAIAVLIVQVGIRCGFWCAAGAGAGAATADLAYSVLAVTAGGAVARPIESIGGSLRWISAGVLVIIGVVGLYRGRSEPSLPDIAFPRRADYAATYAKFLGLTVLNPLTVVYFAAFVLGLGVAEDLTAAEGALFSTGVFLASLSWQTLLAGVGAFARHRLPARFRIGAVAVGNLLVISMAVVIIAR